MGRRNETRQLLAFDSSQNGLSAVLGSGMGLSWGL